MFCLLAHPNWWPKAQILLACTALSANILSIGQKLGNIQIRANQVLVW
ncbi:hypothetical protein MNBD_ALPHA11-2275 [hydrothermal vent metagenome]|uniref:Uncharacterized protein n=1 Tax=hydrothermal vent metagenome TaxID=652676 RepID=A0A3B0U140_9ZZZZ